jgi:hypothetical protein
MEDEDVVLAHVLANLRPSQPPPSVVRSVSNYLHHGLEPGSFVRACLENDLRGAFANADHQNRLCLFDIVSYLYNDIPSTCWGSVERVKAWLVTDADTRRSVMEAWHAGRS